MDAPVEPFKARRIYLLLRSRLMNGQLAPGLQLPSEPELAAEHGVSRVTVRRALGQLADEGLIERRPGAGTFARDTGMPRPIVVDLANVFSHLIEMGRKTSVRLLAFNYVTPPPTVAEAFKLRPNEKVQRSIRVRLMDGAPFSYLTTYVPERIGLTYSEADLGTTPLLRLLESSGVVPTRATQTISATLAEPEAAEALQLEIGSPLLALTRVVYDAAGAGVEHLHALYRPDRYSFQMDLERDGVAGKQHWNPVRPRSANGDGRRSAHKNSSPTRKRSS